MDRRALTSYTERYEKLSKEFPLNRKLHPDIKKRLGVQDEDMIWHIEYRGNEKFHLAKAYGGICFSGNFEDYAYVLKTRAEQMTTGFVVQGDGTINALYDHEYAHMLSGDITLSLSDDDRREFYRQMKDEVYGKQGMSEYATSNEEEFFAEGFSAWYGGEGTEFAKAFGTFIKRWL